MNTVVTANNMEVRAVAEQGLLINEVATATDTNWDNLATANQVSTAPSLLYPSSTADGSTWYHAASTKSSSAAKAFSGAENPELVGYDSTGTNSAYETLSGLVAITSMSNTAATAGTEAKRETMGKAANSDAGYYVHYVYYLKSSGDAITLDSTTTGKQYIAIKSVSAVPTANNTGSGTSGSTNLNKSIRVGIKVKDAFYIYAPLTGFTGTYYVAAGTTATSPVAGTTATPTDLVTLPASSAAGTQVDVYIWYEGEDENCKTDNATAAILDNITIEIKFELATVS